MILLVDPRTALYGPAGETTTDVGVDFFQVISRVRLVLVIVAPFVYRPAFEKTTAALQESIGFALVIATDTPPLASVVSFFGVVVAAGDISPNTQPVYVSE